MKQIKFIIFDIGGVLADLLSGDWFITNNFFNILPKLRNRVDEVKIAIKKNMYLQDMRNIPTEQDEAKMFYNFYKQVFIDLDYKNLTDDILNEIVNDIVFNDNKFRFFDDVIPVLENLSSEYKLGILSDGWVSSYRVLKNYKIDKYFDTIFISSKYGCVKKDGKFFELLKEEMNISDDEAIFIDDRESILEVSTKYGFIPIRMSRNNSNINSKFEIITSLVELENRLNNQGVEYNG